MWPAERETVLLTAGLQVKDPSAPAMDATTGKGHPSSTSFPEDTLCTSMHPQQILDHAHANALDARSIDSERTLKSGPREENSTRSIKMEMKQSMNTIGNSGTTQSLMRNWPQQIDNMQPNS